MADASTEEPKEPSAEPGETPIIRNRSARRRWRIFGWSVIAVMILLIIVNMAGIVYPDVNKAAMIVLVAAYLVYVIFRRR